MPKVEKYIGSSSLHAIKLTPENEVHSNPLVLIHGSWGGMWAWNLYANFFADNGYTVVALDLRGHGESGGEVAGATMRNYVEDVYAVTSHFDLRNPVVIGHSMGGLIALMYTSIYSAAGAVSINGSPTLEALDRSEEISYPETYTPIDTGMTTDPKEALRQLPDMDPLDMKMMNEKLSPESGVARSERKKGISIPREKLSTSTLFVGSGLGDSIPFGISPTMAEKQAEIYGGTSVIIPETTHPGILVGRKWSDGARAIAKWLEEQNL